MNNVLTKVLGASDDMDVDVHARAMAPRERILLCSDGLHGLVPADALQSIVAGEHDLPAAVERLIRAALDGGGRDNVTAVLMEA
jgi:protein phosphatase